MFNVAKLGSPATPDSLPTQRKSGPASLNIDAFGCDPRRVTIFWQSAGVVTIGTTAHFEGIMLAKTLIAVNTGASANGRLLAQTAVTLQKNAITQPAK